MRRLFASLALLLFAAPARAEVCGNVTEHGLCQDAKTLVFCHEGELETMRCAAGELCANDDRFGGAAGCIATRYMGCGAVTEQGLCAGDTLLFCANERIEELVCPEGTRCGAVTTEDGLEHDCLVATVAPVVPEDPAPVEPGEDGEHMDEPEPVDDDQKQGVASDALPSVEQGGAGPASDYGAEGGAGCQGGPTGLLPLALLALLRRR